jgi:DNA polymerase-3 subunit epsilon
MQEGRNHLFNLVENFQLCQKLCGLYETTGACFHYQIHQCNGACLKKESASDYNLRVNEALENYHFDQQNLFIVEQGREEGEKSIVKIEHGKYIGFGFVDEQLFNENLTSLHECIQYYPDNKEVRQIINSHLKRKTVESTIVF